MFLSPSWLEGKVIPFINRIIENSLNDDAKKNIIRYKNSIMINKHLQLAMKNLEKWQIFCEKMVSTEAQLSVWLLTLKKENNPIFGLASYF